MQATSSLSQEFTMVTPAASGVIDALNAKYAGTVVSLGTWRPPAGGNVGGKISYTRVPTAEDFW